MELIAIPTKALFMRPRLWSIAYVSRIWVAWIIQYRYSRRNITYLRSVHTNKFCPRIKSNSTLQCRVYCERSLLIRLFKIEYDSKIKNNFQSGTQKAIAKMYKKRRVWLTIKEHFNKLNDLIYSQSKNFSTNNKLRHGPLNGFCDGSEGSNQE